MLPLTVSDCACHMHASQRIHDQTYPVQVALVFWCDPCGCEVCTMSIVATSHVPYKEFNGIQTKDDRSMIHHTVQDGDPWSYSDLSVVIKICISIGML